ncbi:MOSC domain-containing protein [Shewanella marina]|uniref:MOSC domain-containing protein n=1 Tax=Shewanella marina TaxID=487319 RepID=UPI00047276A4|nr:MOSC domain-containing protein [Shewanella marina]
MLPKEVKLIGLYRGDAYQPLANSNIVSGIAGKLQQQNLQVNHDSVVADWQVDRKHHGGVDRVLHHFPVEHYAYYQQRFNLNHLNAPMMGENISSTGLLEQDINIGDIIALGSTLLQVTQPRSPCFKLNLQFNQIEFARTMQDSRRCGWFYRVLTSGEIKATDQFKLIERVSDISVAEAMALYFRESFDLNAYQRLLGCETLAQSWQRSIQSRINQQRIEAWDMRLYGPATQ